LKNKKTTGRKQMSNVIQLSEKIAERKNDAAISLFYVLFWVFFGKREKYIAVITKSGMEEAIEEKYKFGNNNDINMLPAALKLFNEIQRTLETEKEKGFKILNREFQNLLKTCQQTKKAGL
jgi:hypothetical protein